VDEVWNVLHCHEVLWAQQVLDVIQKLLQLAVYDESVRHPASLQA
jgi:hypothetical protein